MDPEPNKRKRDGDDDGRGRQKANLGSVNYLIDLEKERLSLIDSEANSLSKIIDLITEYEAVIERNESLAASLGAKLYGQRLMKGISKFFEGPIKTSPLSPLPNPPVSWIDICAFAISNPKEFVLTSLPDGTRGCHFTCKDCQVTINEDDWRFISSGAVSRIPFEQPLEEDEMAELATLDILEQRTLLVYKKADEVAARARILNRKLGTRKQDISCQRQLRMQEGSADFGLKPVNQPRRDSQTPFYDLHEDLLQQFSPTTMSTATPNPVPMDSTSQRRGSGASQPNQESPSPTIVTMVAKSNTQNHHHSTIGRANTRSDAQTEVFRPLVTERIGKLMRGEPIDPPCDRCRRLKLQCVKHLSACQACTKKHTKCGWKMVTVEEAEQVRRREASTTGDGAGERHWKREVASPNVGADGSAENCTAINNYVERDRDLVLDRKPGVTGGHDDGRGSWSTSVAFPHRYELPPMRLQTDLIHGLESGAMVGHGHSQNSLEGREREEQKDGSGSK